MEQFTSRQSIPVKENKKKGRINVYLSLSLSFLLSVEQMENCNELLDGIAHRSSGVVWVLNTQSDTVKNDETSLSLSACGWVVRGLELLPSPISSSLSSSTDGRGGGR
jgi:hypothetical protein